MELRKWHLWFKQRGGQELRELVMREWDPIGVRDVAGAQDEYDGYLGRIADRMRRGASAREIAALLHGWRTGDMGLPPDAPRDLHAARMIVSWHARSTSEAGQAEGRRSTSPQSSRFLPPKSQSE